MKLTDLEYNFNKSENLFLNVFTNNTIGMIFTDLETTRYIDVNKSFLKLSGYTKAELVGKTALELNLIEPVIRNKKLSQLKNDGDLQNVEILVRKKNGESFCSLVSVQKLIVEGKEYAISSFIDITERKKNDDRLEYLASIVESSEDAIISISLEGTILSWNFGAYKMYGYTSKQAIGKNISIIIPPEYINEEKLILERILNNEIVEQFETIRNKINGKKINISITISALKNEEGQITGVSKIARDITEQKKASYVRSLIETSLDPFVTISVDGKITDVNEASIRATGISREKLISTDFSDYFTDSGKAQRGYEEVFKNGFVSDYPLTMKHSDGTLTHVLYNASVYKDLNGKVLGVFAAARDITKQKQSSHYARSLIEASLDPLVTIDARGIITDVNEAMVRATDKSRNKIIGTPFQTYFIEKEKAFEIYKEVFVKGVVMNYPLTIIDGVLTDVLLNASVYKNEEEEVVGAVIVARDITELKRIEKELTEAKVFAELATIIAEEAKDNAEKAALIAEEAVKSKQQFLSNMSHEIRTPMNAIIGFTKVLLKTDLTAKQKEYLTAIKLSGDALIVLINDILDLAKVDAGKMVFEQVPFKIELSISAMLHLFETKIQEKNLILENDFDKRIPTVLLGDPVRLHQIILNLLSNAVKFTNKGKITVSVRLLNEDEEKVSIEFGVTDSGIGITESKIERIFENFQQASSGTSRLYGGTGLGLAIVKQLVEPQGGSIKVVSKIDEGSTFSFTLEFKKTSAEYIPENEIEQLSFENKNIKVLVVEDIALNQLLMKTLLDEFGFERDIVANGKLAVEKLESNSYDIILMDLQMPEMNGFEATEYIRNILNSKVPIIALTADVTTVDLAKCKAVGMNDYIAKPVDEKLLYNKIIGLVKKPMFKENIIVNETDNGRIKTLRYTDLVYLSERTKSNPQLMMEMISLFLVQTPSLIKTIKQSLHERDWNLLYSAAHKIIPSFSIMGMSSDYENMARKIQDFASTQMAKVEINEMVIHLENVCDHACRELEEELIKIKNTQ